MKNILNWEITGKIRDNNLTRAREITDKVFSTVEPIILEAQDSEKQDEALFIMVYARKWNDIVVMDHSVNSVHTSLSSVDATLIKTVWDKHLDLLVFNNLETID